MRPTERTIDIRDGAAPPSAGPASTPGVLIVTGGIDTPASIPDAVFQQASATFLAAQRLDMGALASSLGWSRATLYRKAPPRETLLGEVVWFLTRLSLIHAIDRTAHLTGPERVAAAAGVFLASVANQPGLRHLLDHEPEVALRLLTSKHGPVQAGMTSSTEALLREEARRGHLQLSEDARTLAYAIVRIGEGFLYADLITGETPDTDRAARVISLLLQPLKAISEQPA